MLTMFAQTGAMMRRLAHPAPLSRPGAVPVAPWPEILLGVAALAIWLGVRRGVPLMSDVVWQFWIARQLIGGARLYSEIWEVNPPLWFWSAVPVEWLAECTGLDWQALLQAVVIALGAFSAWLVGRLVAGSRPAARAILSLLVFAMITVVPVLALAQREQIVLAMSLPYCALIARRRAGGAVSTPAAAAIGALAAFGFALKHYFVLAPLLLEGWLALRLARRWRPWRPELVVLAALAIAYAGAILILTPDFFGRMVPLVRIAYHAFQPGWLFLAVKPYTLFWLLAVLWLVLVRNEPLKPASPELEAFAGALLLFAASGAVAYGLQGRGWDYHSVPASGALGIAIGLRLKRLRQPVPLALGVALLAWMAVCVYPVRPYPDHDPALDRVASGESVFVAAVNADRAWPVPDRHRLVWAPRTYSMWMVPAIAEGELLGRQTPALRSLSAQVLTAMSEDIRCHPPALILIQREPVFATAHARFELARFLFRDPALSHFVAEHYRPLPPSGDMLGFARQGRPAPPGGSSCRAIRA